MHVLLSGASGSIGRFVLARLRDDGHEVTALGRRPVEGATGFWHHDLADEAPRLPQADALVHCAFQHVPGRFRGGEGDDPDGFRKANAGGTLRLFEAARDAGCASAVFLSSRAVYGDARRGEILREGDPPAPDSLYGSVKLAGEEALRALSGPAFQGIALRATGVYGLVPGTNSHKWAELFEAFSRGEAIAPRRASEVHGEDLAGAVALLLSRAAGGWTAAPFEVFNVSDLVLEKRDLFRLFSQVHGLSGQLPERASDTPGIMDTDKLRALGWAPGGEDRLLAFLRELAT